MLGRFTGYSAQFNFGFTPILGSYPAATPGSVAVGASDALRSITKAVYATPLCGT